MYWNTGMVHALWGFLDSATFEPIIIYFFVQNFKTKPGGDPWVFINLVKSALMAVNAPISIY